MIQLGWERPVHLHAGWMGFIYLHKEILGSVADVKPTKINWKVFAMACVWGWSAGSLIYVPVWLIPQKTACRCPWEGESWLSELSILLGYQRFASMSECFLPEKCSQLYFFSTGFMETLCLSSPGVPAGACPSRTHQVLPSH